MAAYYGVKPQPMFVEGDLSSVFMRTFCGN